MFNIFTSTRRHKIAKLLLIIISSTYLITCLCWILLKFMEVNLPVFSYKVVNLTITLKTGQIQGTYKKSYNGRYFLAFEGIPYAAPPVGKNRFQSPRKISKWDGILHANTTHTCIQMKNKDELIGDEDCLYLNVYVPKINMRENFPVIVNFHSGNFMKDSPNMRAGPTKFMDRDVVYVRINYRLGVLGFFSTFDEVIPGNFGLKDQSYALKWIRKNIENFGGNKKLVTIIGMSAGGASVHYHYFSTMSKGLFHRGISQSGTAIDPWALKSNELRTSRKIYRKHGCTRKNLLSCMRKVTAKNLVLQTAQISQKSEYLPISPLGPVVETDHKDAFLTIDPYYLLITKEFHDVPYLITTTTAEGIFPCVYYLNHLDHLNKNWEKISPLLFDYYNLYNEKETTSISNNITKTFFQNQYITRENFNNLIKLVSERLWDLGAEKSAKFHAIGGKSNVYLMKIGYGGENLYWDEVAKEKLYSGVGHLEDAKFYYDDEFSKLSEKENEMKDILFDIITDFAKFGKTGVQNWKPVNHRIDTLEYLLVKGPNELYINTATNRTVSERFWNEIRKMLEQHCYG